MKNLVVALVLVAGAVSVPASATHVLNPGATFTSRGDCEAALAEWDNEDGKSLPGRFPDTFDGTGEARSFIQRAFTCDLGTDGLWHVTDRRLEILTGEWWQKRK